MSLRSIAHRQIASASLALPLLLIACLEIPDVQLDNPNDPENAAVRSDGAQPPDAALEAGSDAAEAGQADDAAGTADSAPCPMTPALNVANCDRLEGRCAYEFWSDQGQTLRCNDLCPQIQAGLRCVRAWPNNPEGALCVPAGQTTCDELRQNAICACSAGPAAEHG